MTPWQDDDAFWEAVSPFLFPESRWGEAARSDVDQVVALASIEPGAHILDLCCGPGRHSLELARRGFTVTAVDRTIAYLEQAGQQAATEGLSVDFIRGDMLTFCRPGAFDIAINLFTSFGFFDSDADELTVLRNIFESLKSGGRLVMEMMGKEVLARKFQPHSWQSNADSTAFLLEERKVRPGWSHVENRWIMCDDKGQREFRWTIRVYSGAELDAILRRAGFRSVTLQGGLDGGPYDDEAKRLVAVATK
jgi:SAM-dependent methyltransferase